MTAVMMKDFTRNALIICLLLIAVPLHLTALVWLPQITTTVIAAVVPLMLFSMLVVLPLLITGCTQSDGPVPLCVGCCGACNMLTTFVGATLCGVWASLDQATLAIGVHGLRS